MVKVYHDSLKAHGAEIHFIPENLYKQGDFVICISTNHSDIDELSFEQKGNMSIYLKFSEAIASTQRDYLKLQVGDNSDFKRLIIVEQK